MRSEFKSSISKEEIAELEVNKFRGELYYVDSLEKYEKAFESLQKHHIFGFDTETKPTFKKGKLNDVSLLQLSVGECAFLFRLNKIGLPESLAKFLADPNIQKIGVAIHDDLSSLQKITPFEPAGFIDLQTFVKDFGILDNGLKKLTANVLGFKISKRQQTSNWEADVLTEAQIEYAATDAWVCFEIYKTLMQ